MMMVMFDSSSDRCKKQNNWSFFYLHISTTTTNQPLRYKRKGPIMMPTKKEVRHLALTVLLLEKIRVWSIGETKTDPRIMMINLQQDLSRLYPRDQDTYTNDYIRVLEGT
jgi:hypothetical protein